MLDTFNILLKLYHEREYIKKSCIIKYYYVYTFNMKGIFSINTKEFLLKVIPLNDLCYSEDNYFVNTRFSWPVSNIWYFLLFWTSIYFYINSWKIVLWILSLNLKNKEKKQRQMYEYVRRMCFPSAFEIWLLKYIVQFLKIELHDAIWNALIRF